MRPSDPITYLPPLSTSHVGDNCNITPAPASLRALLLTQTPALLTTQPSPPDDDGICWRSLISPLLIERAREQGSSEYVILSAFLDAMGVLPFVAARIEAGRTAPTAEYRERAARVLGIPVERLFERIASLPAVSREREAV